MPAALLAACCAVLAAAEEDPGPPPRVAGQGLALAAQRDKVGPVCVGLAAAAWPDSLVARRERIAELQRVRPQCMDDAPFLASLGALLLQDGDAEQALVWLERSLLLDPENLGARADHALALAELGQPEALQELSTSLRHRSDVPAALRARLFPPEPGQAFSLPPVRLGRLQRPDWGTLAEVNLLTGYESNLDRSPSLSELTLTFPDGPPLVLPVLSQPRSGAATLGSAALQLAYAPQTATILRTGLSLTARGASSQRATDWHQWQWAASASHSVNGLRGQFDFSLSGFGGPLGEPYELRRAGLSVEAAAQDCRLRLAVEVEQRTQSATASLDSQARGWLASVKCPLFMGGDWTWSLALGGVRDRPDSAARPGGMQRLRSAGLRVSGSLWQDLRLELAARSSTSQDETGYSPLLQKDAPRRLTLQQWSVELAMPLRRVPDQRFEAVLQWQAAAQASNLPLFIYRADSLYAGLRWLW